MGTRGAEGGKFIASGSFPFGASYDPWNPALPPLAHTHTLSLLLPACPTAVTQEALLQWLLQQCATLADVPEPLTALRLMLAGALAASEEAQGLEMLAYVFLERVRRIKGRGHGLFTRWFLIKVDQAAGAEPLVLSQGHD